MQRRNVEVSLSYHVTFEEHMSHSENIVVDLVDSTDVNG